jgi:tRNA(Arg) A34 adenosine deaminase TadA
MIPPTYKPKKNFVQLAIAEARRACDRGDYPIGAVITRVVGKRKVVIASAGNRVKTSGSSIKHVELETLKYVSSSYGRYLPDFVLYSTHEPCAMRGCLCLVQNRGGGIRRFPRRYHRLRQEAWHRGIQMAGLSHFMQIRP